MSEVKRYDPSKTMLNDPGAGRYVRYKDYKALAAENQRLREALKLIADEGEMDCPCGHHANKALQESGDE